MKKCYRGCQISGKEIYWASAALHNGREDVSEVVVVADLRLFVDGIHLPRIFIKKIVPIFLHF